MAVVHKKNHFYANAEYLSNGFLIVVFRLFSLKIYRLLSNEKQNVEITRVYDSIDGVFFQIITTQN